MHSIRNFVPILRLLKYEQDLSKKTLDKDASEMIQDGLRLMLVMDSETPKPKLGTNPLFPLTSDNRHLDDRDVRRIFRLDYRGHGSLKLSDEAPYPMDMEKIASKLDKLDGSDKTQSAIIFKKLETILDLCADAVAGKKSFSNGLLFCNIQKSPFPLKLRQVTERSVGVLAYMGVAHRNRKNRGEQNSVVYGICTDTYSFTFLKIDNDSSVYHKRTSGDPCGENHPEDVTGNIQNILKDAYEDCGSVKDS